MSNKQINNNEADLQLASLIIFTNEKILCNLFLGCCISYGSYAQQGYVIKGTVDGMNEGKVNIVVYKRGTPDTLNSVPFKNGFFEMRGDVVGTIPATLQIGGQTMGETTIFLENKEYHVKLNLEYIINSDIFGGGKSQKLWNEYRAYEVACNKAVDVVREEFIEALQTPEDPRLPKLKSHIDSLGNVAQGKQKEFLKKHATSYVALNDLAINAKQLTLEGLKESFKIFPKEMQNSFFGELISTRIRKLEELKAGEVAPDFTVQTPEGKFFTLHSVKAELKLVDFWASWCGPCRVIIPELKKLYADFHNKGFEIVSISMDDRIERWIEAIQEEEMSWLQGSNLKGNAEDSPLIKLYGIFGIPHLVLIDSNNRILETNLRGRDLYEAVANFFKNK